MAALKCDGDSVIMQIDLRQAGDTIKICRWTLVNFHSC
jgi:hypothetical protein